jgi:hypothetical protein
MCCAAAGHGVGVQPGRLLMAVCAGDAVAAAASGEMGDE